MELFATDSHFILLDGEDSLWIDRSNGRCDAKKGTSVECLGDAEVLGTVYGYIGKLRVSFTSDVRLVFIRQQVLVGNMNNLPIFRITSVLSIPLEGDLEIAIENCSWKNDNIATITNAPNSPTRQAQPGSSDISAASSLLSGRPLIRAKVPPIRGLVSKKVDSKVDRRMLEEFHKMFTEAESFYYSPEQDITNSLQRRQKFLPVATEKKDKEVASATITPKLPLWEMADKRFFWNWYMVKSLINAQNDKLNRWIVPVIQGFIQYEPCIIEHTIDAMGLDEATTISAPIGVWLISRRSRYQAGTRYLRRGVDDNGKVANYVESEQIVVYKNHMFSFVQVRGSIPVFWSQSNSYRYRPPPKIEREDAETYDAFTKHFEEELGIYDRVLIINLVEKGGKEKVLGDAYIKNVLQLNSSKITYVSFDFHVQCRGMKFDNVSILTNRLCDTLRKMGYCWTDPYGMVLQQEGIFRVNCVDCLDRTNVVQTHLAKEMLTFELSKVGLIAPEIGLPSNVRMILQTLWANNGDTLSKQYAGTNALKGDFTRTGERKFAGVMKDGMNSANRYYLNRFRDTSRQAAIDLMLGIRKSVSEADFDEDEKQQPFEKENGTEQIKSIVEDVKRCMIPSDEVILGAWGLVNGKLNELDSLDVDSIFVLTERNYYVTEYDCSLDTMTETQRTPLTSIASIELSFEALTHTTTVWSIFSSNNSSQTMVPNMKINYCQDGQSQYHEFRSSNIRFFNNVAVPIQQPEEMHEALRMVSDAVKVASASLGNNFDITTTPLFQKDSSNKGRIPGMASNFMNKYLSTAQPADSSITKKISAASFDRLKYFRRGSGTLPNGELNSGEQVDGTAQAISEPKLGTQASTQMNQDPTLHLGKGMKNDNEFQDLIDLNAMTPDPLHIQSLFPLENDLVLPSCGILSPGRRNNISQTIPDMISSPLLVMTEAGRSGNKSELQPLPLSQDSSSTEVSPSRHAGPKLGLSTMNSLQRHRNSLPVCSLGVTMSGMHTTSPQRSRTPEITITEELSSAGIVTPSTKDDTIFSIPQQSSSLKVAMRRISRSSEDVNKVGGFGGFGMPRINAQNTTGFKLPNIFGTSKTDQRSSSNQNIFDSVGLKGSHSDNALRDNPFQSSQQPQKRGEMVLAPLGKLAKGMQSLGANYLDPRKIRESLKPIVKQDSFEDKELEEKKRLSETEFIDV